jgi:hypothetical protein
MTLPGFTKEVYSSHGLKGNYYYRYSSQTKSDIHPKEGTTSYAANTSRIGQWKPIPEPQKEPSESGRSAWIALRKACNNLQCEECRKDCIRFINGLHDAINIKLGKPIRTPNDFIYLRGFINEMSKQAFVGYRHQ